MALYFSTFALPNVTRLMPFGQRQTSQSLLQIRIAVRSTLTLKSGLQLGVLGPSMTSRCIHAIQGDIISIAPDYSRQPGRVSHSVPIFQRQARCSTSLDNIGKPDGQLRHSHRIPIWSVSAILCGLLCLLRNSTSHLSEVWMAFTTAICHI